jgi:CubicO group peptidase (beta-lactamase class C family)
MEPMPDRSDERRRGPREVVLAAQAAGITPAAVLAYGDGDVEVDTFACGVTQLEPADGALPVDVDTIFDCASVTKPTATVAVLMRLVADGRIDLDTRLPALVPEATAEGAGAITVRHLVGHASGYPAHIEFFRRLLVGERAGAASAREAIVRLAGATPLAYEPGTKTIYSDLGFILLGACVERAGGARLDQLAAELVTGPLGMSATRFVDLQADPPVPRPHPVAATELCFYRGLVRGEVHDDNSWSAGGICGHAGLFSTVGDLGRFARALLPAARGERSLFDPGVVRSFFGQSAAPDTSWRLGWDTPSPLPSQSHAGDLWPRDGVGHTGFTGTCLWLDPPRGRYAILLTNRVHPYRDKLGILPTRRAFMDAVVRTLEAR